METPRVKEGTWIKVKTKRADHGINAYVLDVFTPTELSVGYYQNNLKAIKTDVKWADGFWQFSEPGPHGSYLRGVLEGIVKNGPQPL